MGNAAASYELRFDRLLVIYEFSSSSGIGNKGDGSQGCVLVRRIGIHGRPPS